MVRTLFCFLFLFAVSYIQAQERVEVTISDTLLHPEKEDYVPGGRANWEAFLRKKINPLVLIDNGAPNGKYTVRVQYIVDKDGNTFNAMPLTSLGYGMEQEVIRTLRTQTRWVPAKQEGTIEKIYHRLTVIFIKENENYHIATATPYTLYAGVDNPITVSTPALKPRQLKVTVSKNATIKSTGNFTYTVNVNTPGEWVIVTLKDRKRRKVVKYHIVTVPLPAPAK